MVFPAPHHVPSTPPQQAQADTPNRLFWRWWRKQSPSQQDRYATLGPLVSVLLFLAVISAAFWSLRNEELLRLRLIENQEHVQRLARDVNFKAISVEQCMLQASDFVRPRPEVLSLSWVQANEQVKAVRTTLTLSLESGQPIDRDP